MPVFFKPTEYNGDTKQQLWLSLIGDSHDIFCGCTLPFAHLLNCIFPPGHSDRELTVQQIITRDKQQCPGGGEEEEDGGLPLGASAANLASIKQEEEGGQEDIGVEELLAAAAAAESR